jgi:hypothetical protein
MDTISRTRAPHAHRFLPDIQALLTSTGSNPLPTNLALNLKLRPVSFDRRHGLVFVIFRHVSLRMSSHQALQYLLLPSLSHPRTSSPTLLPYLRAPASHCLPCSLAISQFVVLRFAYSPLSASSVCRLRLFLSLVVRGFAHRHSEVPCLPAIT